MDKRRERQTGKQADRETEREEEEDHRVKPSRNSRDTCTSRVQVLLLPLLSKAV